MAALWEEFVGMEMSIGMLIFKAVGFSEEATREPTPLLNCSLTLQEAAVEPSHGFQASVAFFLLEMSQQLFVL